LQRLLTQLFQTSLVPLKSTWYILPLRPFLRVPRGKELGEVFGVLREEDFLRERFLREERFLAPPVDVNKLPRNCSTADIYFYNINKYFFFLELE
jgi:hypothetical protein